MSDLSDKRTEVEGSIGKSVVSFARRDWNKASYEETLNDAFMREYHNDINWDFICQHQVLTESFLTDYSANLNWDYVCIYQKLTETFIRNNSSSVNWDHVNWDHVSRYQSLSESFITEFEDDVNWNNISRYQSLSESFMRDNSDKINWIDASFFQQMSESFITEFTSSVDWLNISEGQILTTGYISTNAGVNESVQLAANHDSRTNEDKQAEMTTYANANGLTFNGTYLFAFRDHDQFDRGYFDPSLFYSSAIKYTDWRCNINPNTDNTFGFGIKSSGNTPVKVHYDDWGVEYTNDTEGNARVFAFTKI